MKKALLALLVAAAAAPQTSDVYGDRIRAHVKFLASDLLEGRGVGTRGGDLATEYLATQFELIGAKPAGAGGSYFQNVPLVGIEPQSDCRLSATGKTGTVSFRWLDDFVGTDETQKASDEIDADAIFVG